MKAIIVALLVIGLLSNVSDSAAQLPLPSETLGGQEAPTLNQLKLNFDIERAELAKPLKELDQLYQAQLDKLLIRSQDRGILEQVIAVRAEKARLEGGTPANQGTDFEELSKVRSIYEKSRSERIAVMHLRLLPAIEKHLSLLGELRTSQTKQRLLDDAVITNGEVTRVTALETEILRFIENPGGSKSSPALPNWSRRSLGIRVQVDGVSHLHLKDGKIWFDHSRGRDKPPGRHLGEFPTYLNETTEWFPVWDGEQTLPLSTRILIPEDEPVNVNLLPIEGRGKANVIQQPTFENHYTAVVELRDEDAGGRSFASSDWLEFRLSW